MNCTDWNTFHSLEDVNASYHRFLDSEYNNGSHSSIGMTPKERYLKDFDSLRFLEKTAVEEGFLHRITRKVTPTATVSLFNIFYEVPQQYIGCTIHLRYRPEDMSEIYIYDGDSARRLHTVYPVKKLDNARRKRRANLRAFVEELNPNLYKTVYLPMTTISAGECYRDLTGQPTLNHTLSMQIHEELHQRIVINYSMQGLIPEEVADYTRDRMKLCGVSEEIFEVAALGDRFWNREQL